MARARARWALAAAAALAVAALGARAARGRTPALLDCSEERASVVLVDTRAHAAALCERGARVDAFTVRIGRRGAGKRREGDGKTPLGVYPLGAPRPSAAFGTFVPIGYPTAEQRAEGYTGSAVGLHGPHRRVAWAGAWANAFDTTDGCIGLATDDEMQRAAAWIARTGAARIVIR